jgi:hypothetical protein
MGKTNLANAYNDLINLFKKGINPIRGRGSLDVAPLSGGVSTGTTASGNAYMDGPFTLVANRNHSGPITNINQVGGIIVNEWLATPEVLTSLRDLFPNLAIESTSNTKSLIEQLNSKTQEEVVSSKTQTEKVAVEEVITAPKLVRDISVLITPATVRAASPLTKRIKTLSVKYDKLVKEFSKTKDKKTLDKIKEAEAQILNDAKQEIIDDVSKVKGVSVSFGSDKRGLWDGSFEPSLNMSLSISPQADTQAVSEMLFDFSEKYSQDAFILEADSNYERDVMEGRRGVPLTEFDENGLMHYPQIVYTFDAPITDEQVADLSVELQNNGVDAFSINNDEIKVSVIKFFPEDSQLNESEQYEERTRDLESKQDAAENAAINVLGPDVSIDGKIKIKKSSYQGAKNEGTADQSREYDRSDVLKPFQETVTDVELRSTELAKLRQKQIDLQSKRQQLSKEEQERFDELNRTVQPTVQKTFEVNKALYEDAKSEVEKIAEDATKTLNASLSPFPIKRPERASVKTIRWYNSFTEKLGDGARVNIVVENEADAKKVFDSSAILAIPEGNKGFAWFTNYKNNNVCFLILRTFFCI